MDLQSTVLDDQGSSLIEVNGVHMGMVERGRADDASIEQTPVVLIHGFTGSGKNWASLSEALVRQGWHVIALEMLGHGRSDAPDDPQRYTIEHCQADVVAALRKLNVAPGKAILIGYSMGARIALYCALSGYFGALVLESGSPGLASQAERDQRRRSDEALATRIEEYGVEAFVDYWEELPVFSSQVILPSRTRAALRDQRLHNSAHGLANSLRGVGTGAQPSLYASLAEITIPTLLITGADDKKFCDVALKMAEQMPQVQHHIVPGAGHTVHLEQPAAFEAIVREFCSSVQ
jgi:2-succinyl-6-hydroxy-2,4-cyclohexadiene-1-carboxylate synthase